MTKIKLYILNQYAYGVKKESEKNTKRKMLPTSSVF